MDKCNKYEELFIQEDERELLEHIKTCPDCTLEHKKMEQVSKLIKEVAFTYRRKRNLEKKICAMAASFLIVFMSFCTLEITNPDSFVNNTIAKASYSEYSFEEMGLPVDDYGFIKVDSDY